MPFPPRPIVYARRLQVDAENVLGPQMLRSLLMFESAELKGLQETSSTLQSGLWVGQHEVGETALCAPAESTASREATSDNVSPILEPNVMMMLMMMVPEARRQGVTL